MKSAVDRFESAYSELLELGADKTPLRVADQRDQGGYGYNVCVMVTEGDSQPDSIQPSCRAIGYLMTCNFNYLPAGKAGEACHRITLQSDQGGNVTARYSDSSEFRKAPYLAVHYVSPDTECVVPEASEAIALESALMAVEQALQTQS